MAATTIQTYLTKILTNRINAEIKAGTLAQDTDIQNILDIFVAADKITADEYQTCSDLVTNALNTSSTSTTSESSSGSTATA
jgi:hypothetical protein